MPLNAVKLLQGLVLPRPSSRLHRKRHTDATFTGTSLVLSMVLCVTLLNDQRSWINSKVQWTSKPALPRIKLDDVSFSQERRCRPKRTQLYAGAEGADEERPAWDVLRAVQTAAYYDALPNPFKFLTGEPSGSVKVAPGETIWSEENVRGLEWGVLDDVVMGGASQSFLNGTTWTGNIITQGGGFAGIRTKSIKPALDMRRCEGLRVRVRGGDGQRFKLIIRDSYDWNGIAWSFEFDTKTFMPSLDGVVDISAPFRSFVPTLFAKKIADQRFDAGKLTAVQITLSKFGYDGDLNPNFRAGKFSLTVESITAY
eukprot:TRINITY_DN33699_c0_g1_i1.p1 TRINITY_DN33699_c0_g1~~TRINITY_DN33699_c0_g1_i1.p1  ORF type:complete len:328 (-),score=41.59 TRINITY_DN33699_c0_g1_i1:136-1071(-)